MDRRIFGYFVALTLLVGACGGNDHAAHGDGSGDQGSEASGSSFGEPAEVADAERTIKVEGSDRLRFEPDAIQVSAGETVAFEFVNTAQVPHEFVLGDSAAMEAHQEGHAHGSVAENATGEVAPGDSKTIAWTFSTPGEFVYECHIDEHDEAGMRGSITVSES